MIHRQYACCLKRQAIPIGRCWTPGIWLGGLFPSIINFVPEGRCQSAHFLSQFLMPLWLSGRQRDVFLGGKNETSHLKEILCHSVIFKLTAFYSPISLRKRKEFSFSPPTATLTGKDIHLCLNAWGKQKCKTVSQCFLNGLAWPQEI